MTGLGGLHLKIQSFRLEIDGEYQDEMGNHRTNYVMEMYNTLQHATADLVLSNEFDKLLRLKTF